MSATLVPVILAGGGGTRLWPLSRRDYPKQFLAVTGTETLLQQTLRRVIRLNGQTVLPPLLVCNEEHRFLVAEQARSADIDLSTIVLEPAGRNTAPALTAAALLSRELVDDDAVLIVMPADHMITDVAAFGEAVSQAMDLACRDHIVTFGIAPTHPETGYGYIETGEAISNLQSAWRLNSFKEKPDEKTARAYLEGGNYLWNSGIFVLKASVWHEAIEHFVPAIATAVAQSIDSGVADGDFFRLDAASFRASPSDSIDYAVMENLTDAPWPSAVVALDGGWSDVGSWDSVWSVLDRDEAGNATHGDVIADASKNSVIHAEHRLVAALGCEDLVVVETADAVLVMPKAESQDVKLVVEKLDARSREEHLHHRRVHRPWGSYESVDSGARFQVKRIVVKPGAALSLQMHHHRAEHWVVVSGTAQVTCGDNVFLLAENESTYIPIGAKHRLVNPGTIPLEIIEIQSGTYLGEDDIVRFEDIYNRAPTTS